MHGGYVSLLSRRFTTAFPVLLAALVVLLVSGVVAVRPDQATGSASTQGRLGPVLLVPGYGGSTRGIEVLAARVRAEGRSAVVVQVAGDGRGDLAVQAKVLDRSVRQALFLTQSESVDIIGYSAGGVIARLWAATRPGVVPVRRIVTLGSPHHGTDLVGHGGELSGDACPTACDQLRPGSSFLAGLASAEAARSSARRPEVVSVWTAQDSVVPWESSQLDNAMNISIQSICADLRLRHGDLPVDPAVARLALLELAETATVIPTSGVCDDG